MTVTLAAHPRLFLDSTNLARIKSANFTNLKAWCDEFLHGTINEYLPNTTTNQYPDSPNLGVGYEGEDICDWVINYSTMYQVSGNVAYGNKAVALMLSMSTVDGKQGTPSVDDGYIIRNYGLAYGIGYDWCYNLMTAAQRTQIYTSANLFIKYWESGGAFESSFPYGNYYAGYYVSKALCSLAMYEDNPSAPAQWQDWRTNMFGNLVQPFFAQHSSGGGWAEGYEYGVKGIAGMAMPLWAVKTATGEDLQSQFTFALNSADALIHATWPNINLVDDDGEYHSTGDPARPINPTSLSLAMLLRTMLHYYGDSREATMRQFISQLSTSSDALWQDVLYFDDGNKVAPLTDLSHFVSGLNVLYARSGWSTSDTWLSYKGAAYGSYDGSSEQFRNEGELAIVNGANPFLLKCWGWGLTEPGGDAFETAGYGIQGGTLPYFNIFLTSSGGQNTNLSANVNTWTTDQGNYVYAKTTGLEQMYDSGVTKWQREVVYLRPGVIVVRDSTTDNAKDRWMQWHFQTASVTGNVISTAQGQATMAFPSDCTTTINPIFPESVPVKIQQVQVRSVSNPGSWVTVFDTTKNPSKVSSTDGLTVNVGSSSVVFGSNGVTVNGVSSPTPPLASTTPTPSITSTPSTPIEPTPTHSTPVTSPVASPLPVPGQGDAPPASANATSFVSKTAYGFTISNNNLTIALTDAGWANVPVTDFVDAASANHYWTVTYNLVTNDGNAAVGIVPSSFVGNAPGYDYQANPPYSYGVKDNGNVGQNGKNINKMVPFVVGDIAQFFFYQGSLYIGKVGSGWYNTTTSSFSSTLSGATPMVSNIVGSYGPAVGSSGSAKHTWTANFGATQFTTQIPSGASGWNVGGVSATPVVTPTPSATPAVSLSPSITPSISVTKSPKVSPSPSPTISLSKTPIASPTPSPTNSLSSTPQASPSASPSVTPSVSPSVSPSSTPTVTSMQVVDVEILVAGRWTVEGGTSYSSYEAALEAATALAIASGKAGTVINITPPLSFQVISILE
jgi:hypothetical protein